MKPQLSVAIMHHPSRRAGIGTLVRACAPLEATVVADPRPDGPPSPLRTAKKAWAAIRPGATHHVVLQDDLRLTRNFAAHLTSAIASQPEAALTLYVNWHSTPNSYLVRRAVEAGSAWAPLYPAFVPTLGLVLPAEQARELARFLEEVPDDVRHDDRAIAQFCGEHAIPVLAAVPHLLQHGNLASVAGNELDGDRHATVFADDIALPSGYWHTTDDVLAELASRAAHRSPHDFALELHNSETRLRFARPGAGEHIWHPYGWYWHDWCELTGTDPDRLVAAFTREPSTAHLTGDVRRLALELWAAGHLLGLDSANPAAVAGPIRTRLLSAAFDSWIACGLLPEDRRTLDPQARRYLADLGVTAVDGALADRIERTSEVSS